jgi:hypothetical protein
LSTFVTNAPAGRLLAAAGGRRSTISDDPGAVGIRVVGKPCTEEPVGGGAGGDEFSGDALGLVDGNRETETDRTAFSRRGTKRHVRRVLIPTSPRSLTKAPPELPGLSGASVWMASIAAVWSAESEAVDSGRSKALMMPAVTVPSRPSGEPTATTPLADAKVG